MYDQDVVKIYIFCVYFDLAFLELSIHVDLPASMSAHRIQGVYWYVCTVSIFDSALCGHELSHQLAVTMHVVNRPQ